MEPITIVIIIVIILIAIVSIKSYIHSVKQGCCGTTGKESSLNVKVKDKNPDNYKFSVRVDIEGMSCKHCAKRIEDALNSEDGVWAAVDLKNNCATILMKEDIGKKRIKQLIEREGYKVTNI